MASQTARAAAPPRRLRVLLGALVVLALFLAVGRGRAPSAEARLRLYRGVELANRGDAAGAEREWRAAAGAAPSFADAHRALGSLYVAQGRLAEARTALHRLADLTPRQPHLLCELAEAEYRRRTGPMLKAAAEDGARAAVLEPDCVRAQTVAGNAWMELGDSRRGLDHLRRAARLSPGDVPLALHLVRNLLEGQRLEEAAALAEELTRRYPGYAQAHALLATCYQLYPPGSPQAKSLPEVLKTALELDPTNALAQAQMGHHHVTAGRHAEAVRHLEVARLLVPTRTSVLFDLQRAYAGAGRKAEADRLRAEFRRISDLENELAAVEKRLVLDPGNQDLLERLRSLAADLGEPERAARFQSAPAGEARGDAARTSEIPR